MNSHTEMQNSFMKVRLVMKPLGARPAVMLELLLTELLAEREDLLLF